MLACLVVAIHLSSSKKQTVNIPIIPAMKLASRVFSIFFTDAKLPLQKSRARNLCMLNAMNIFGDIA